SILHLRFFRTYLKIQAIDAISTKSVQMRGTRSAIYGGSVFLYVGCIFWLLFYPQGYSAEGSRFFPS
ncbi:MAG: hypothetical protein RSD27_07690, partial [Ruthenibacterium sp.]